MESNQLRETGRSNVVLCQGYLFRREWNCFNRRAVRPSSLDKIVKCWPMMRLWWRCTKIAKLPQPQLSVKQLSFSRRRDNGRRVWVNSRDIPYFQDFRTFLESCPLCDHMQFFQLPPFKVIWRNIAWMMGTATRWCNWPRLFEVTVASFGCFVEHRAGITR